jgi:hydroxymethylpyrimidine pyrophosphatase-like HAD family hydrolase
MIIISDIDNTILKNGVQPMQNVVGWLKARSSYDLILVTGRLESDRKRTIAALKAADVKYKALYMNPYIIHDRFKWKEEVARKLNIDGNVAMAIDNDVEGRNAFSRAGVKRVLSPDDLSDDVLKSSVFDGVFL